MSRSPSPATGHPTNRRWRARVSSVAATVLVAAGIVVTWQSPAHAVVLPLTQYVNPFIGTDDSNSPNPVARRRRRQHRPRPGAALRHGAVQPGHADRVAVGLPLQRHPDPGVQPDPLQRRRLLEQRGHRHPADHRQPRHLARHRLDQLRGHPDQGQRGRPGRLLQGRAQQLRQHPGRADRHQAHRRSCG